MFQYSKVIYYQGTVKAFLTLPSTFTISHCLASIFVTVPNFIRKNWIYSFFSSFDKHQSLHLVEYHITGINYLLIDRTMLSLKVVADTVYHNS